MSGIIINGISGHMGRQVAKLAAEKCQLVAGIDCTPSEQTVPVFCSFDAVPEETTERADCIVDFSNHLCTIPLVEFAVKHSLALVIATTGQSDEEMACIKNAASKIPVFLSANYSMGVAVLIKTAKAVASVMKDADIEIVEIHHNRKIDAPSGTAKAIADAIKTVRSGSEIVCGRNGMRRREQNEIGISSVRCANIVGIHEVIVATENECLTLKHEAFSRSVFADGAMAAAEFLKDKPAGYYTMSSLIEL